MQDYAHPGPVAAKRNLFTPTEFVVLPEFDYLSMPSLRHLLFNAKPRFGSDGSVIPGNGLIESGAIIRLGRKILIDADRFREWVSAQRDTG